ncbi:MAG: leucine--tRNA ligase [Spirochaetales bacterium]|nr:leucine--tRNA ligase [Spirochaetales bacterium]
MDRYDFKQIEEKWQKFWEKDKTFKVVEDFSVPAEKRMYVLDMFPYPSGAGLHVGHPEGYTATDIYCRFLTMNGYKVLHPMGFDSFGLPAENYAIKTGTHPEVTTSKNIDKFREQIKALGFCYDWDREISTHTPEYYKWTQWIFLKLYEKGLAYEAKTPINWCPSCLTGLANEEVKDGACDRCGTQVTRKNIRQWILRITDYAEKLLEDLDSLDWSDSIKAMQKNWIGKSEGANVTFSLKESSETIEVYTTRPDTLFGATYMVLAPEHPLVAKITTDGQKAAIDDYIVKANMKSDLERTELSKEKSGVFTGAYAINPVNNKEIPIWISDYILISYGTGAIMAVPAHDQRDWEFATKFGLDIVQVLEGGDISQEAFVGDGPHVNSEFLDGLGKEEAISKMIAWLEGKSLGTKSINYKLRDWVFSRQRYWGEPIPLVHCPDCGIVPVPESELPLTLPDMEEFKPSGTGESPLANVESWLNTTCPKCGGHARRETNTMPQWAGSCWYYLRYIDPHNTQEFASQEKLDYWMPVDLYVGGAEHAVLHLLYARFWHKVLYDIGLVRDKEPFKRLVNQGMITSFAFQRKNKSLVPVDMVKEIEGNKFVEIETGEELERVIAKMSKSLKNVINPDDIIREFGADSMRMYEMFMGPLQVSKPWQTQGLIGVYRFLDKIAKMSSKPIVDGGMDSETEKLLHKTIKKVYNDTNNLDFNVGISQMMIFVNHLHKLDALPREAWEKFILILSPYAPHLAEELWEMAGNKPSVAKQAYPSWDESLTKDAEVVVAVQVNGKLRAKLEVAAGTPKEELESQALAHENVKKYTDGATIRKVITIPDKIVNIVAN